MRRYGWVFVLVLMIGLGVGIPAHAADPLLLSPDFTGGPQHPLGNYQWDANGYWDRWNPIYDFANTIMQVNAFLTRLGIWVLDMGYAPSNWLAPFQAIADVISKSHFLEHIWPFFVLIAAGVLIKDLTQHHIQRVMQRGLLFVVAISAVLLFNAIGGTPKYIQMVTEAMDGLCYATSGWILTVNEENAQTDAGGTGTQAAIHNVDKEIWQQLITAPWELGEPGTVNATVGRDVDAVRQVVSGVTFWQTIWDPGGTAARQMAVRRAVSPSTPWRDVLLSLPVGDDKRNQLAAILNNDDHPEAKQAFQSGFRFVLALFDFVAVLCADIYLLAAGVLLSLFYLLYLAWMISGVVVLPVTILPWGYSYNILRWWGKALAGSVVFRVGLSAYVGLTFFVEKIITTALGQSNLGGIAALLLYPAILAISLLVLSRIYKRLQPVRQATGNVFSSLGRKSRVEGEEADAGDGGEPAKNGNKKGKSGESHRTARRVDPDRGAGANTDTLHTPERRDPDRGTDMGSLSAPGRRNPDADSGQTSEHRESGTDRKATKRISKPVRDWAKGAGRTLRRMGHELREGDAAGAGYVLIRDTARGSAENAWKATKWGARMGWQEGKRFYKWLEQKIDDPPSPPPPGGGGGGSNGDDNNDNNNGGDDSYNNRRRRIDPDRMDWAPETRDLNYWESVYRDDPNRPRLEPPGSRTEEDWQNLLRQDPAARSGDASPNPPGGGTQEPENRAPSDHGRTKSAPDRTDTKDRSPESEARPVNPDSGTQQPATPGQESPKNPERPSDWQRWAGQPERKDQEPKRTDAPAFRRPVEPRVENEHVEENVQRTNPDKARVTETQGGPGPLPRSEAAAEPRAKQEPPRVQAPSRENAERREEVEQGGSGSKDARKSPPRVEGASRISQPEKKPEGPAPKRESRYTQSTENAERPRNSLWARWARTVRRNGEADQPQNPDGPERPPERPEGP